jgi:hypothetical protein
MLGVIGALYASLLLEGCGLILNGATQVVPIESSPPGAHARVEPGGKIVTTPGAVTLVRKHPAMIYVEKEGYEAQTVTLAPERATSLWRNLVWIHPAGLITGIIVDLSTGACDGLVPERVDVTLVPVRSTEERTRRDVP